MPPKKLTALQEKSEVKEKRENSRDDYNSEVMFHENRKCLHHDGYKSDCNNCIVIMYM